MQKDEVLRCYLSDNARYADLMNGMIVEGRSMVQPEDLQPLDSRVEGENGIRYHDLIRRSCFGVNFAAVGIENQEEVHYLMPLRCAEYDVYEYRRQARKIERRLELDRKRKRKCRTALERAECEDVIWSGKDERETGDQFGKEENASTVLFGMDTYRGVEQADAEGLARDIMSENPQSLTSAEYLSKFRRTDRLHPL